LAGGGRGLRAGLRLAGRRRCLRRGWLRGCGRAAAVGVGVTQLLQEGGGGGVAAPRVARQRALQDGQQGAGRLGLRGGRPVTLARSGGLPGEHVEQRGTERVEGAAHVARGGGVGVLGGAEGGRRRVLRLGRRLQQIE